MHTYTYIHTCYGVDDKGHEIYNGLKRTNG